MFRIEDLQAARVWTAGRRLWLNMRSAHSKMKIQSLASKLARPVFSFSGMAELGLHVEPKQHYVSVLYHVLFAFLSHQTLFLGCGVGTAVKKVLIIDHLGLDEAPLKV